MSRSRVVAPILVGLGVAIGLTIPLVDAEEPVPARVNMPTVVTVQSVPRPVAPEPERAANTLPSGTFAKSFDAGPYGSGTITWTYAGNRVTGVIEVSMGIVGADVTLVTDAEVSVSRNGVVYGVTNQAKVTKLKFTNPELLKGLPFPISEKNYTLIEPLVNDIVVDLPFSYQCRVGDDQITILSYRTLLAGPNPLGRVGGLMGLSGFGPLSYFQVIGIAVEGTYTRPEPDAKAKTARAR